MPGIDKSLLARRFGKRVESYEDVTPVQQRMAETLMGQIVSRFNGRLPARILELGCGTGRLTRRLLEVFPKAELTAVDISGEMTRHAARTCPSASFVVADAEAYLRHAATRFDLIAANAAVQWFETPQFSLPLCRSRLTENGRLAVATFGERTFMELHEAFRLAHAETGVAELPHALTLYSAGSWRALFPDAEILEERDVRLFPSVRAFLHSVQQTGAAYAPTDSAFLPRRLLRAMVRHYGRHFGVAGTTDIRATYHILFVHCPAEPQQSALEAAS